MTYQWAPTPTTEEARQRIIQLRAEAAQIRAEAEALKELQKQQARIAELRAAQHSPHRAAKRVQTWATHHYGYTPEECAARLNAAAREFGAWGDVQRRGKEGASNEDPQYEA